MPHRKKLSEVDRIELLEKKLDRRDALFNLALFTALLCLITAIASGSVAVDARTIARDTQDVSEQTHASQIEACERGNDSRVSRIENYRRDIKNANADIRFGGSFAPALPAAGPFAVWTDKKSQVIKGKRKSIREEIKSIRPIAVKPGSSVVDCALAYPK